MERARQIVAQMAERRQRSGHPYYAVLAQELRAAARAIVQDPDGTR